MVMVIVSVVRKSGEGIKGAWSALEEAMPALRDRAPKTEGLNRSWTQAAHPRDLRSREDGWRMQERRAVARGVGRFGQAAKPARNRRQIVRSNGHRLLPRG
jgi:hypothetical protein